MTASEFTGVAFPPPPWHSRGLMWFGLLRTSEPVAVPAGLRRLLPPNRLAFLLIRYLGGTLRYDEFMVGVPARCGLRCGLWVRSIWVDDSASMWGGREIWGVPKQLAGFDWGDGTVEITDDQGQIAALSVVGSTAWAIPVRLLAPGFGARDGRLLHFAGRLRARARPAHVHADVWSDRLPPLARPTARPCLALSDFRMTVSAPRLIAPDRLLDQRDRGSRRFTGWSRFVGRGCGRMRLAGRGRRRGCR